MAKPLVNKAFAVGLLVAVSGAAFLVAYTFFRKGGFSERDSYAVHAYFSDATGLTWKSRVQIAGIQVGEVEQITLEGQRARLRLRIGNDVDLRSDACLSKRFPSALLPDALLDAVPGTPQAPSLRELPEDQREVKCVNEAGGVAKLLDSLQKISADISVVSGELAETVRGERGSIRQIIENLARISQNLDHTVAENSGKIGRILDNAETFTGVIAEVAGQDKDRYRNIARNVEEASARLNDVLANLQDIVGTGGGGGPGKSDLKESAASARSALEKLNRSLEDIQQATAKIAEGKGVAGKLLTDERLGEKVGGALEGVSNYVDRLVKLQIQVELRSEWLFSQSGAKTYAGLRLLPRPDKYYLFEIVSDPRNAATSTTTETVTSGPLGGPTTTTRSTTQVDSEKLRFSLEFAKSYGPVTLRAGLIESSGGIGGDLHLLDDSLQVSMNVYQFARPDVFWPRTKVWANVRFLRYLYATAGVDDVLNNFRRRSQAGEKLFVVGRDVFFGAGITFTDEDLKTIFLGAGSAVGGAASSAK
jgi:phospholipid/cholesterol/gamma-HCH transport system substrate-binding protein